MNPSQGILAIAVLVVGCMPFPRYSYLAETRVGVEAGAGAFSAEEIARARLVAADVAKQFTMKSDTDSDRDPERLVELEQNISSTRSPPRTYLSSYHGSLDWGRPIRFRLELSDDGRTLIFSISDYERGTPEPVVTEIRSVMMERVEAAFLRASIVHEAQSLGPFFDGLLSHHQAVQPPSTGITAPVT